MEQAYEHVNDGIPKDEKRSYWETAFGLQAVDELKPSKYMRRLAAEHVAGEQTYDEVCSELNTYYESVANPDASEHEADGVSVVIYNILEDEAFRFAEFTSRIWQVHPFYEGNTRTTAVFYSEISA